MVYDIKKDIKAVQKQSSVIVGFWRVVTVDLENGTESKGDNLYETREEAETRCKELDSNLKKNAWDIREYESVQFLARFFTFEEVVEEKHQKLEKWHSYVRTTYLDPVVSAAFRFCCQRLVADMQHRVEKQSNNDINKMRHEGKRLYSPWQTYGCDAKLWAYMQLEPEGSEVSYWGMFTKNSLYGCIYKRIRIFESVEDFKTWLADTNQATETLEKCMLNALHESIHSDELPQ